LLTRFVDGASVEILDEPVSDIDRVPGRIPFDVSGSPLGRTGSRTTYETILSAYAIDAPAATILGTIVREIEIDAWRQGVSVESQQVESAFRRMQIVFGRGDVTRACYLEFFDAVATFVAMPSPKAGDHRALIPDERCMSDTADEPRSYAPNVPLIDLGDAAMHASLGADVTFLDTREAWEFEEGHIPGAINMPLRDISAQTVAELLDDDLVIAYCVKDFRGYEAAKRLRGLGIEAVIMKPYGMRGWIAAGLPVAGPRGLPVDQAEAAMRELARSTIESR